MKVIQKIDFYIEKLSSWGLVISIISMLFLSITAILFRWFGVTSLWIEPLVRHIVFLAAFLGGSIAAGKRKHISIDVLPRFLDAKKMHLTKKIITILTDILSIFVLMWLVWASFDLSKVEFEYGSIAFLKIHSGYLVSIMPIGFMLITYRFIYHLFSSIISSANLE